MAFSMQNPNLQQTFEDFKPLMEKKDTPDALLLLIHLPGFTRQQIGATLEAAPKKVTVFGEKPIDNNKRKRFKEEYFIPETCDSETLSAKFDGNVITITMPKKPIPSAITPKEPEPEPKPAQEEAAKPVTPPTPTSGVEAERATKEAEKAVSEEQTKSEMVSQREYDKKKDETPTPPEAATRESQMPQKSKETPQKDIKEEEKHRYEMETKDPSTPEKAEGESQKDQKGKLDYEKLEENQRAEKEKIQEENKKTSEAGKEPQKVQTLAREPSKEKAISSLKTPEKREKETDVKTGKVNQRDYGAKESELPPTKGIKDIANSASQAVTRLADKFREEDKQKLLYAGAAILIVAVGIYASFKLRSTGRQ